jgi:hypothetical protein
MINEQCVLFAIGHYYCFPASNSCSISRELNSANERALTDQVGSSRRAACNAERLPTKQGE